MESHDTPSDQNTRIVDDRRSGTDTRSESEKQVIGERRSGIDRRGEAKAIQQTGPRPSNEQLALFSRRLRRALNNEKSRDYFGVARGENDFAIYPDVLRTIEWLEYLVNSGGDESAQSANPGKPTLRKVPLRNEM